jgi:hypothetical protein
VNGHSIPPQTEWNFRDLIASKDLKDLEHCYQWEYYREVYKESAGFRLAVDEWRREHTLTAEGYYDEPFAARWYLTDDPLVPRCWFVAFPDWPELPYQAVDVPRPPETEWAQSRKEGHGLQIDLEDLIRRPPLGDWEHWPAGSVLSSNYEAIVALHIDWERPLKDIKEQVDEWLSWAHKHVANRPAREKLGKAAPLCQYKARLKQLTAMRLLMGGRKHKEAQDIYGDEFLYGEQSEWINAKKAAQEHIKKLGHEWG